MKSKLNPRQDRFVREYVKDLNGTQAAIRAGYSKKTAKQIGSKLLTHIDIQEALQKAKTRVANKLEITQEKIHAEMAKIAFSDIKTFASWGSGGVALNDSHNLDTACVQEVSEVRSTKGTPDGDDIILNSNIKFKLYNKIDALTELDNRLVGTPIQKEEISGEIKVIVEQVNINASRREKNNA